MKKYLQLASVLGFIGFLVFIKNSQNEGTNAALNSIPIKSISSNSTNNKTYKDGTYLGSTQDAYYGNIQIKVTIASGKISDIKFLQYPNDNSTSIEINSQAMPILRQETIDAQSANINGVTGASATSPAFIASLTDALNQAK